MRPDLVAMVSPAVKVGRISGVDIIFEDAIEIYRMIISLQLFFLLKYCVVTAT